MQIEKKAHILIVAGPTSSGKSDLAVELALECNGEVISADSRQVYTGLDIGTGKITKSEMRGVKHYCLDIADPGENFSVFQWVQEAEEAIKEIISEDKLPIICGGTGMYIDALVYGLPTTPPRDTEFEEKYKHKTNEEILSEIKIISPEFESQNQNNRRRLLRELEILKTNGYIPKRNREARYEVEWVIIDRPKQELLERIKIRTERRIDGIITETENLLKTVNKEKLANIGIEYKETVNYLENKISREELIQNIITKSWQYAKRQITWNKKYAK
jgi:tRNA dimethylallyltransferase